MDNYSLAALLFAAVILLTTLILVRRRRQREQQVLAAQQADDRTLEQIELSRVQNPSEKDVTAYALIEEERQKIWRSVSTNTSLSPRKIYQTAFDLIRQVAAIYYPDKETPLFQVSLFDLLELNYRVIERIKEHLEEFPLNTIKDVNIEGILRYKDYYDRVTNFQLIKLAQQHQYLYTVGKYAWMGYNALNPWYWGRKMAFTAGKEGAFRYLLSVIVTVVGEESVLVYSKRNLRAKVAAVEKQIAFEMINMAVSDGIVSQEEYEVILDFIGNNPRLDNQMKVTLLKALLRKRPVKTAIPHDAYTEKDRKRLLAEVERVAQADTFGALKKREALKALEATLALTSEYRTKLEAAPQEEVQSWERLQQSRRREEAILRLMVQAAVIGGALPDALREYIVQRAASYPLPFSDNEQRAILDEVTTPTALDTLTDQIRSKAEKERALGEIVDALVWELPFSREKEDFYGVIVATLHLQKVGEATLINRLHRLLPHGKLIEKPSTEVCKYLFRLLRHAEQVAALQQTATRYRFLLDGASQKSKDTECWLCVTSQRVLVLAAVKDQQRVYHHYVEFQPDLTVQYKSGRLFDAYLLRDQTNEVRLEMVRFRSANLKQALQSYLQSFSQQLTTGENGQA